VFVLLEVGGELVGANRGDGVVVADTHVLLAVAEGGDSACAGVGDLVDALTADWEERYRSLLVFRKR
jgi:hypothetical protein